MQDNELDKFFAEQISDFEVEPTARVWKSIQSSICQPPVRKERALFQYWSIAASILIITAFGLWMFRPTEKIKLYVNDKGTEAISSRVDIVNPKRQTASSEIIERVSEIRETRNAHQVQIRKLSKKWKKSREELSEKLEKINYSQLSLPQFKTETDVAKNFPSLNIRPAMESSTSEVQASENGRSVRNARSSKGIQSFGDVINYVLSKVDKRKDKLIEFSNDEEGSTITGINLGVVKIKNSQAN